MPQPKEQGYSAVEALLVVVIVATVGFTGWYVYHSTKKSDATLNAAAKTSAATGPKFSAKAKATQPTTTAAGTDNQSLQNDLNGITSASNQDNADLTNTNSSLVDQSTFTSVPQ